MGANGQCERRHDNVHVCSCCGQAALHTLRLFPIASFHPISHQQNVNMNPQYQGNQTTLKAKFHPFLWGFIKWFWGKALLKLQRLAWLKRGMGGGRLGCLTSPLFPVHGYAFSTQTIRYSDLWIYLDYDLVCIHKEKQTRENHELIFPN